MTGTPAARSDRRPVSESSNAQETQADKWISEPDFGAVTSAAASFTGNISESRCARARLRGALGDGGGQFDQLTRAGHRLCFRGDDFGHRAQQLVRDLGDGQE
ncbi:hypothetical protein BB31_36760 [Amycolatopsis lurida NRRL 2430]|uniref:Uncharacterized protein n=1 Tax=Amycolatopsis lurida NRRL 2430 TaxID=1460371 RepID=A0A2P2FHS7_AMYLU|nr:hypothetical protein BB31_36760 [Amycolatopsis lurida NRRL 2430]